MTRTYHKTIVFTKTPLLRTFKYKDIFQIYPANLENMPDSNLKRHYPIILEYWTDETENVNMPSEYEELKDLFTETATLLTKQDMILSLLTVISNHLFFRYNDTTGMWGIPILKDDAGEEANTWSSKWNLAFYHAPGLPAQLKITEFTNVDYSKIDYVHHFPYYLQDPNLDFTATKEINFPATIDMTLDSYFSKSDKIRVILDTAISYTVSAMELRQQKKTLSIISSFTAVETMVNLEYRDAEVENCETCGQQKFKVAAKYRDYLLKYIGTGTNNKKKFNMYYSLRSKIVHTGVRLKTETLFADLPKEEKDKEFLNLIEILQMGKLAIIQWLLNNP